MRATILAFAFIFILGGCAPKEPAPNAGTQDGGEAEAVTSNRSLAKPVWVDESVSDYSRKDGFLTLFVDEKATRVFATFPAPNDDSVSLRVIYAAGLTSGLGTNPIGLDRGLFDGGSIIAFRQVGNKLIAEKENWGFRASADNPLERKAVRESFARSFLWAGDVTATGPNGEVLVDITTFLTRDALNLVSALKNHSQGGDFSIAADRTFPDITNVLTFPDNVEFDAYLTLTSNSPGREVQMTSADGRAITFVQHHSFVRIPDEGYRVRYFDPRAGAIDEPHYDFSSPLNDSIIKTVARRFRLEKQDPSASLSPPKKPITFYVDSGAPPQVRDALTEGASWWADAFEAAGFKDAFRVEPLPEGAHPRDIRYNVISWTHRQTRGWSYGGGVSDPRTGEMIKGSVILGSQRVRQDRMIFEGLVGADNSGTGGANDPVIIALNRIKQLSAHEVGHALGFAHNFAASSNNRASVMDYPAPLVTVDAKGALDLSNAYDDGIGAWDKTAARWLYSQFPEDADEAAALNQIIDEGYASGLRFIGDSEGRSIATAHPYASVWDNGEDAVASLRQSMDVRKIALANFGARSIQDGRPYSDLRAVIVPIYLFHRYQVAAAAKLIGGFEFSYNLKDDGLTTGTPVADDRQRAALAALIETLDPEVLELPDSIIDQLTPPLGGFGSSYTAETFHSETGPLFDLLTAADNAATITMSALLNPQRAARIIEYQNRDESRLSLNEVLQAIEGKVFAQQPTKRRQAIAQQLQVRFVSTLIGLSGGDAGSENAGTSAVQAVVDLYLRGLRTRLAPGILERQTTERAHREWLIAKIEQHFDRTVVTQSPVVKAIDAPPGSPIGNGMMESCWHCD